MNRRTFAKTAALAFTAFPSLSFRRDSEIVQANDMQSVTNLHAHFDKPVPIDAVEIFSLEGESVLRVSSGEHRGYTLCNQRLDPVLSVLSHIVIPFFTGRDARDMETLVDEIYRTNSNYKLTGLLFWNAVGHVEIAVFDMLGRIAGKPVNQLIGSVTKARIPIYISSTTRETTAEEEVAAFEKRIAETGANALKYKIGGRMSRNADAMPGRSEKLTALLRQAFGADFTLYADANGSYDVQNGILAARMLASHDVEVFEEPVPFDEYENTAQVSRAMRKIKIAGGEQDTSLYRFDWLARNRVLDILQPDLFYNGGFIRCLKVAQSAHLHGVMIAPHSPKTNPLAAPMLHFTSVLPNLFGYQEWHISQPKHKSWYSPHFQIENGGVAVPSTPGLGVAYDHSLFITENRVL